MGSAGRNNRQKFEHIRLNLVVGIANCCKIASYTIMLNIMLFLTYRDKSIDYACIISI